MNPTEIFYLNAADRGFLSTADSSGRPTVIPVCFIYMDGRIYVPIDDKPKTTKTLARLKNLASNPIVAFIVDNYSQDWTKLSYLLIHGRGRVVHDKVEEAKARGILLKKYVQYLSMRLEIRSIIAVDVDDSRFWAYQPR